MHEPNQIKAITPDMLVYAYSHGIFPMAASRESKLVEWFCPDPRAVLPLDQFHLSKNLRKKIRRGVFTMKSDTAFTQVMEACASPRASEDNTWINDGLIAAYTQLHEMGLAHSVEAWRDGELVGGLYGVHLGGAFFGESMFHRAALGGTDASKIALAYLVGHMREQGFKLLDVQLTNKHLLQFGIVEMTHEHYMAALMPVLEHHAEWEAEKLGELTLDAMLHVD